MAYCTRATLYEMGLPRGGLVNPARPVASVDTTANAITLGGHGFDLNAPFSFRAEAGGELPQPLAEGVTYYAIAISDDVFKIASAVDGAALDLLTSGERVLVIAPVPIDASIDWAASLIDDNLPAHVLPLVAPYPPIIVFTNAELAIGKLLQGSASKSLADMVDAAIKRLAKWASGVPLRGKNTATQQPANLAAVALSVPYGDSRGWSRGGGLC